MFTVTARTAKSPIIYNVLDFSIAITDPEGDVTAQALAVPVFVGMLDFNVKRFWPSNGKQGLEPGDIIIGNDPGASAGRSHLQRCLRHHARVIHEGTLVAFTASKGHWNDIGGMSFGS